MSENIESYEWHAFDLKHDHETLHEHDFQAPWIDLKVEE